MTDYTPRIDELTEIMAEKKEAIAAEYPKIGEFFFGKYLDGADFGQEFNAVFSTAMAIGSELAEAENEVAALKAKQEAERRAEEEAAAAAAAQAAAEAEKAAAEAVTAQAAAETEEPWVAAEQQPACEDENIMICPACGEKFSADMKFCCYCGAKLEAPKKPEPEPEPVAEAQPAKPICPVCGAELGETAKFCTNCGTPTAPAAPAMPVARICPGCGATVKDGDKFCIMCGYRMG